MIEHSEGNVRTGRTSWRWETGEENSVRTPRIERVGRRGCRILSGLEKVLDLEEICGTWFCTLLMKTKWLLSCCCSQSCRRRVTSLPDCHQMAAGRKTACGRECIVASSTGALSILQLAGVMTASFFAGREALIYLMLHDQWSFFKLSMRGWYVGRFKIIKVCLDKKITE